MRITPDFNRNFSPRIVQLIGLSCVIALSACQDITAPEKVTPAPELRLATAAAVDALKSVSSSLTDMTGWSLATLDDQGQRGNIVGVLNGLSGHLNSGNLALCQKDVTAARSIISSLSDAQQAEVGPVSIALDVVQQVIDGTR